MRAPKHIRDKDARRKAEALWSYLTAKENNTLETSKGYRMSGSFEGKTHRFSMHPGKDFTTSSPDKTLTSKQRQSKYRLSDGELYDGARIGLNRTSAKADTRCMVRVGTIPEHHVPIKDKDTQETRVVKVRQQPRFKELGQPGIIPKDGGK